MEMLLVEVKFFPNSGRFRFRVLLGFLVFLWLPKQSCNLSDESTQPEKILLSCSVIVFLKTHFPFYMD